MKLKITKKRLIIYIILFLIILVLFFPSRIVNKVRIENYYKTNKLDSHQLELINYFGISNVETIRKHKIKNAVFDIKEVLISLFNQKKIEIENENTIEYQYIDYFGQTFWVLNFLGREFNSYSGVSMKEESLISNTKNRKSYYYYFTLSRYQNEINLYVFKIRDYSKDFTKVDDIMINYHNYLR